MEYNTDKLSPCPLISGNGERERDAHTDTDSQEEHI